MVFPGLEGQDIVTARLDIGLFSGTGQKSYSGEVSQFTPGGLKSNSSMYIKCIYLSFRLSWTGQVCSLFKISSILPLLNPSRSRVI